MRHNNNRRMKNRTNNNNSNAGNQGGGRRSSNVPPRMQVFDSNGPDVRIRGTAWQVHEKYVALAKDAASSGDSVLTESYLQHAEHYQRIINTFPEQAPQWSSQPAANNDAMDEEDNQQQPVVAQQHQQPQQQNAPRADRRDDGRSAATDLGLPSSLFKAPAQSAMETA